MSRRVLRYLTFGEVAAINKTLTSASREEHAYEAGDERRLNEILENVRQVGEGQPPNKALAKKAAYLLYSIAAKQPFHEGNKRTAYLSAQTFLAMSGYRIIASLEEVFNLLEEISRFQTTGLKETEAFVESHMVKEPWRRRRSSHPRKF